MLDSPLRPLVKGWMGKIRLAIEHKNEHFQREADECMKFFTGPYLWMYRERAGPNQTHGAAADYTDLPAPSFQLTVNKAAELEQLFAPYLAHRNPHRTVTPRRFPSFPPEMLGNPADPNVQQLALQLEMMNQQGRVQDQGRATLMEHLLNYTPQELSLKTESRLAIIEGLIKGMGIWWIETYRRPGTNTTLVGSFWDSVDNLLIDPDLESLKDAQWVARRCVHPVWEVERKYHLEPGTLKGNLESLHHLGMTEGQPDASYFRRMGKTNDLLVYWKVWSKMGVGSRMSGELPAQYGRNLDIFGDYCYLVICDGTPYPLNLPPELTESADLSVLTQALQWQVPFWADGRWPFEAYIPHPVPRSVWPMSHLKPGLGLLRAINWLYSMIITKIRVTCRDFLGVVKGASEEVKNIVQHGPDLSIIELEQAFGNNIGAVVQFLQHPDFNPAIWSVLEATMTEFEKSTGLTELMYGQTSAQMRSATEAQARAAQVSIRPDDLADKFEDAMGSLAASEAIAVRWLYTPEDVTAIAGPVAAYYWQLLVMQADIASTVSQLEYRIEAGSTKKPNKAAMAENLSNALQNLAPVLMQAGQLEPLSNLLRDWAAANDLDPDRYGLQAPPPLPPPGGEPGGEPEPAAPALAPETANVA